MHHSVGKTVGVRKHAVRFRGVAHVFLNAEIGDAEIEMQSGGSADGAHVRGAVAAGADLIDFCKAGNFSEMGNSASVHDGGADVVDQLLLDELLAIVNGIENLADGERRSGMAANQAKAFLQLGGVGSSSQKR